MVHQNLQQQQLGKERKKKRIEYDLNQFVMILALNNYHPHDLIQLAYLIIQIIISS